MDDFSQALPKQTEDTLFSELPQFSISCAPYCKVLTLFRSLTGTFYFTL